MALPTNFQFSQASLQDYVDCPRRFELRYVRRLRWPAVEVEPARQSERRVRRGAAFHRLVFQHLAGIPVHELSRTVTDPSLRLWWRNYLESRPSDLPPVRYPEVRLGMPMGKSRLVAQYDLVAVDAGRRVVIVDWKTSRKRPGRDWLLGRLQSRVYAYLLVEAGALLNGGALIRPSDVTMIYWFANFPADPEHFGYSVGAYQADGRYLRSLVGEIEARFEELGEGQLLPHGGDESCCPYCRYRSFCERGIKAGLLEEMSDAPESESLFDFEIDFEQIAELDYS